MKPERLNRILDAKMMQLITQQQKEKELLRKNLLIEREADICGRTHWMIEDQYKNFIDKQIKLREEKHKIHTRIKQKINSEVLNKRSCQPVMFTYSDLKVELGEQMNKLMSTHVEEKEIIQKISSNVMPSERECQKYEITYEGNNVLIGNYYSVEIDYKHDDEIDLLYQKQERMKKLFHDTQERRNKSVKDRDR